MTADHLIALATLAGNSFVVGRDDIGARALALLPETVPATLRGRPEAAVHAARGIRQVREGNFSGALVHLRSATKALRAIGAWHDVVDKLAGLVWVLCELGAHDDSEQYCLELIKVAQRIGAKSAMCNALQNLGLTHIRRGQPLEAVRVLRESADGFQQCALPFYQANSLSYLAWALLSLNETQHAEEAISRSLPLSDGDPAAQATAFAMAARVALAAHRHEDAARFADRAMQLLTHQPGHDHVALIRATNVETLLALGRAAEAAKSAGEAHAWLRERAAKIEDEAMRRSFLTNVTENARILELVGCLD
jgi:tetratricopeptide (TPR) repeat protein